MSYKDRQSGQFSQVVAELNKQQEDSHRYPCRRCGSATLRAILTQYGGRCTRCHESWCGASDSIARFSSNRIADPKGWAKALRAAEESGERLTLFQKQAWRDALRFQPEDDDVS